MLPTKHECDATLTDSQVLSFCQDGYMMLDGVVPDEINQRTMDTAQFFPAAMVMGENN